MASRDPDETLRALSVLAALLEPFAGRHANLAAERLIENFGSLGRALAASPEQLAIALDPDHKIAHSIVAARTLVRAGLYEQVRRTPVSVREPAFRDYLRLLIGRSPTECLHATFVTHDWRYLGDELLTHGATKQVEGDLRRLLARAFDLGAHGIILAHNHPSGSAEPSDEDIALTARVAELTGSVGIMLLDHLIVGGVDIVSLRERELI